MSDRAEFSKVFDRYLTTVESTKKREKAIREEKLDNLGQISRKRERSPDIELYGRSDWYKSRPEIGYDSRDTRDYRELGDYRDSKRLRDYRTEHASDGPPNLQARATFNQVNGFRNRPPSPNSFGPQGPFRSKLSASMNSYDSSRASPQNGFESRGPVGPLSVDFALLDPRRLAPPNTIDSRKLNRSTPSNTFDSFEPRRLPPPNRVDSLDPPKTFDSRCSIRPLSSDPFNSNGPIRPSSSNTFNSLASSRGPPPIKPHDSYSHIKLRPRVQPQSFRPSESVSAQGPVRPFIRSPLPQDQSGFFRPSEPSGSNQLFEKGKQHELSMMKRPGLLGPGKPVESHLPQRSETKIPPLRGESILGSLPVTTQSILGAPPRNILPINTPAPSNLLDARNIADRLLNLLGMEKNFTNKEVFDKNSRGQGVSPGNSDQLRYRQVEANRQNGYFGNGHNRRNVSDTGLQQTPRNNDQTGHREGEIIRQNDNSGYDQEQRIVSDIRLRQTPGNNYQKGHREIDSNKQNEYPGYGRDRRSFSDTGIKQTPRNNYQAGHREGEGNQQNESLSYGHDRRHFFHAGLPQIQHEGRDRDDYSRDRVSYEDNIIDRREIVDVRRERQDLSLRVPPVDFRESGSLPVVRDIRQTEAPRSDRLIDYRLTNFRLVDSRRSVNPRSIEDYRLSNSHRVSDLGNSMQDYKLAITQRSTNFGDIQDYRLQGQSIVRDYNHKPVKEKEEEEFHEKWLYGKLSKNNKKSKNLSKDDSDVELKHMTESCHIEAVDVRVFKKMVLDSANSYNEIEVLCEKDARFHFYKKTMGSEFVLENAEKKFDDKNPLTYCKLCNLKFTEAYKMSNHIISIPHQQIALLAKELCRLGTEWFDSATYESQCKTLPEEEEGLEIEMVKRLKDFATAEKPITDDFYDEFDLSQYTVSQFIKKACQKRIKPIWPQTESLYYCSTCNFMEFDTQDALEKHYKSEKHVEYQKTYSEAFCESCQHHFGVREEMRKHVDTQLHRRADKLLQDTRIHATKYWNLFKTHQIEGKVDVKKLPETLYKQSTLSFASTLHPGVFDAAANTETETSKSDAMAMKLDKTYNRLFDAKPDERLLIDNFVTSSGCQICHKEFIPTPSSREAHIRSKKHQKHFRRYLKENKDEFLTPGGCVLCKQSFPCTEEIIITSHRLSKKHVERRQAYFNGTLDQKNKT